MQYSIAELAKLAGVSTRTLRFYDKKGLLPARRDPQNNYRYYQEAEVNQLQKILFLRLFDLSLTQIKQVLQDSEDVQYQMLKRQRQKIITEQQRLANLLVNLDKTLARMKGVSKMTDTEKFAAFKTKAVEQNELQYGQELRAKYSEQTIADTYRKFKSLTENKMTHLEAITQQILTELEPLVGTSDLAQPAAKHLFDLHQKFLQMSWPAGNYSPAANKNLAAMYTCDARFKQYYEAGTGKQHAAQTLKEIIDYYA
ncbi:MerR family transcriptional regulator [Lactobacillus xylocopicola]|uniref:Transcriptional regulator n=1 Tax=Lactobacillus xylocopicola TaxID=2976676 RepID=A0ABN6SJ38_9LACO|nr:MerR family transcriptional regulator [Lactobacillus xylocopicola]BDR60200.1 transcriptional regulator [Lactobacillus xylocopicola]